jgi:signal transduction histidine kinase
LDQDTPNPTPASSTPEAQRAIAELAELAGGLAHELRNPLSTMMINLKLLAEDLGNADADPEDTRRRAMLKVDTLRREAERLQGLFDDFLNLTDPCRLQRQDVDLNALVARLVEFFEPMAHSKQIEVKTIRQQPTLICNVDEKLLRQALLNLAVNAQQAMPAGGVMTIATGIEGAEAVISVGDTGVGIAESDQDRILRPFFSTKASGNGLGLSLTQRVIQEHGGSLTFESELGQGTTFTIRLPLQPRPSAADAPAG